MDRKGKECESAIETIKKTPLFSFAFLIGGLGFSVTAALDGTQLLGPITMVFLILFLFAGLGVMMTSDRA